MLASEVPTIFPIPFADAAGGGYTRPIPVDSQIGIQPGAASLIDGFPPDTFLQIGAGGTPPWGADFNGLFNQITSWNQWQSLGGPIYWNATLSATIGGYPAGSIVIQRSGLGNWWLCIVDNNVTDPDGATPSGWIGFGIYGAARVVTTDGAFTINESDANIGLLRASVTTPSIATLPVTPVNAKKITIEDLAGNFSQWPVTILPGGSATIAQGFSTLNYDRQSAIFTYYASHNIWGVKA